MAFGRDFWAVLRLVIGIFKLFAQIFGDDDDKEAAEENGFGS